MPMDHAHKGGIAMKRLLLAAAAALLLLTYTHRREAATPVTLPEPLPAGDAVPAPPREPAAMTVGGREVPVWLYEYWLGQACQQAVDLYAASGQTPDWDSPDGLRAQVRRQAMADAALCAMVEDWAVTRHCDLTDENRASLDRLWQQRCAASGGEAAYLASLGLTADQARRLGEIGQRYRNLHAQAADPASPYAPTPEQLSDFARSHQYLSVDRIYVSGEDAAQRISGLFSRLNDAPDPAALFPALAREGEDHSGPRTFRVGDGTLSPALEAAAQELDPGSHSGILFDGEGYAILRRTAPSLPLLTARWLDDRLLSAAAAADTLALPALEAVPIPVLP